MAIDRRTESLITLLKSLLEFLLMVCGIIGIAVQIFHDQGLLKGLWNVLINEAISTSLIGGIFAVAGILLGKAWFDSVFRKAENANALGNFLMKAMIAAGVFFLYLYLSTGSFKI